MKTINQKRPLTIRKTIIATCLCNLTLIFWTGASAFANDQSNVLSVGTVPTSSLSTGGSSECSGLPHLHGTQNGVPDPGGSCGHGVGVPISHEAIDPGVFIDVLLHLFPTGGSSQTALTGPTPSTPGTGDSPQTGTGTNQKPTSGGGDPLFVQGGGSLLASIENDTFLLSMPEQDGPIMEFVEHRFPATNETAAREAYEWALVMERVTLALPAYDHLLGRDRSESQPSVSNGSSSPSSGAATPASHVTQAVQRTDAVNSPTPNLSAAPAPRL